jgi:hypothetical protein
MLMDALYEHSPILEGDAGIFKRCSVYTLACGNTLPMRVDHYHRQAVQHSELRQDLREFFQHTFERNVTEPIIARQQLAFFCQTLAQSTGSRLVSSSPLSPAAC